jgi:hypothetical protein
MSMSTSQRLCRAFGGILASLWLFTALSAATPPIETLADNEAKIARHIKQLADPDSEARATAAAALRRIIARYPSGTANIRDEDGGEAAWLKKIDQLKAGTSKAEVLKMLPKFADCPEFSSMGSGQSHVEIYRVDWDWQVEAHYYNPDVLISAPTLRRREARIYVAPPDNYTGLWENWHVNGQIAWRAQYENGKYHGTFTAYHDNGSISYDQHYTHHVANGPDSGWDPDGRLMYLGQYRNGKQDGQWIHWHANGLKRHESNYKDGVENGLYASWYENGQMQYEKHHKNGLADGFEASWDENGVLHYERQN